MILLFFLVLISIFSLDMLREYLKFYSLPSSSRLIKAPPFSRGPAASIGDGQTPFERLPLRLRKGAKRLRVVRALERALVTFGAERRSASES